MLSYAKKRETKKKKKQTPKNKKNQIKKKLTKNISDGI